TTSVGSVRWQRAVASRVDGADAAGAHVQCRGRRVVLLSESNPGYEVVLQLVLWRDVVGGRIPPGEERTAVGLEFTDHIAGRRWWRGVGIRGEVDPHRRARRGQAGGVADADEVAVD